MKMEEKEGKLEGKKEEKTIFIDREWGKTWERERERAKNPATIVKLDVTKPFKFVYL